VKLSGRNNEVIIMERRFSRVINVKKDLRIITLLVLIRM